MGLADRIMHKTAGVGEGDIPIHEWTAAFSLYCLGEATRVQVVNLFTLTAGEASGLDELKTAYDALAAKADKVEFLNKLECAGIFYQNGSIDSAKYKSIMGLS